MAFCNKCGRQLPEGSAFCTGCGAPVVPPAGEPYQSGPVEAGMFSMVDRTREFSQSDININRVMGILSYIGLLCLIPFFAAKESPFAQFHAKQGLNLAILGAGASVTVTVFQAVFRYVADLLYILFYTLNVFVITGFLALAVIGVIFAAKGYAMELPVVRRFRFFK